MSVNGIQNTKNIQEILKMMRGSKSQRAGLSQKVDPRMTMNGSIFAQGVGSLKNARSVSTTQQTQQAQSAQQNQNVQTSNNVLKANVINFFILFS